MSDLFILDGVKHESIPIYCLDMPALFKILVKSIISQSSATAFGFPTTNII